ncbi:hypothetical protein BV394_04955 [Brevirhabdus pacifica]|uniref:Uncharacterized protein n=1 Tax=Brevirhabdus pacifica TaxID=1267768 RepID=A0A1U7DGX6_9RHOB|nr:hypothetical protein BV394_04955 [Brevirhabdus pacifica]OWU76799.1 hypothetical protein ATO5_11335 [Loktanella sp. 22II-4b]PJJ86264.1 hypothetical protein CLV77_0800 [Brevirhabdus pacifica]
MRLWVRLLTLCISLAFLGGLMLHDVAGARMSFNMVAAETSDEGGEVCPACEVEDAETVICKLDCTTPMLFLGAFAAALPERLVADVHLATSPHSLRMRPPGFDPAPPRTTILS